MEVSLAKGWYPNQTSFLWNFLFCGFIEAYSRTGWILVYFYASRNWGTWTFMGLGIPLVRECHPGFRTPGERRFASFG